MPWLSWVHPLALLLATLLADQARAINYSPMAIPLAVKTPYLSSWMQGGSADSTISRSWPINGNDDKITGWAGFARVDGINYSFLGDAADGALIGLQWAVQSVQVKPFLHVLFLTLTIIQITPTQTQFVITCGKVNLNVTFLSPIEPNDFMRMSLPFSYLSVVAYPNDGQQHNVQIYSDLSGGRQMSLLMPS
jgi:hypothetical protein